MIQHLIAQVIGTAIGFWIGFYLIPFFKCIFSGDKK